MTLVLIVPAFSSQQLRDLCKPSLISSGSASLPGGGALCEGARSLRQELPTRRAFSHRGSPRLVVFWCKGINPENIRDTKRCSA